MLLELVYFSFRTRGPSGSLRTTKQSPGKPTRNAHNIELTFKLEASPTEHYVHPFVQPLIQLFRSANCSSDSL